MITYWPSPAKLNLFLYITGKRNDGYHQLQTLFQLLNYSDLISIKLRKDKKFNLLTPITNLSNKDNLIIHAANLFMKEVVKMQKFSILKGADISVKKRLPIGGGLGGGSSNAATILVALNYLWKCGLTENELARIGLKLGADVPIFIYGRSAFAEGIGEVLSPIQLREKWYLVVYPKVNISTSMIFQDPELPRNSPKRSMETLLKHRFTNVCESIVRKRFYEVDIALSWLRKYAPSRLTGTGSCVFAEFHTKSSAYQVLTCMPKWFSYSFVAKGLNFSPLKEIILK